MENHDETVDERRKIAVIVGSDSDVEQCFAGLQYLQSQGDVRIVCGVHTLSVHRNLGELLAYLKGLQDDLLPTVINSPTYLHGPVDVIIAGAGWAAHLPGMIDSHLRYGLFDTRTVVLGVAFEDLSNDDPFVCKQHLLAAKLSISEVPGTQVVCRDSIGQQKEQYVGAEGFLRACKFAVHGTLPKIQQPKPRLCKYRSPDEALSFISQQSK